jgi:hypothetical protein
MGGPIGVEVSILSPVDSETQGRYLLRSPLFPCAFQFHQLNFHEYANSAYHYCTNILCFLLFSYILCHMHGILFVLAINEHAIIVTKWEYC